MKKIPLKKADIPVGVIVSLIFIFFSFSALTVFESLEKITYSIVMRLDLPRNLGTNKIAIVNIDDKSLKKLGPWPWPRHLLAEMISILKNNGAKLIGVDILYSEREQSQGLKEVRKLHKEIQNRGDSSAESSWILNALKEAEVRLDNDKILFEAVKENGNIIFPVIGTFGRYDNELVLEPDSFLQKNSFKFSDVNADVENFISVNQLKTPFTELSENSRGLGHINFSRNDLMRGQVHPLFINFRGHIIPSMPFRLALEYFNKLPQEVFMDGKGIRLLDTTIPIVDGEIFIKFKGGRRSFPYYSFVDILKVKKVPAVFRDKIVLIGYTASGAPTIDTPVDPKLPRVELTANIIDNLLNGRFLRRPDTMKYIEGFLLVFFCLFGTVVQPRLNFINRVGVTAGSLFLVALIGVVFFMALGVWFKTIYIELSLVTVFVVFGVRDFMVRQRAMGNKESIETNRMLGLSFQSQGLLDLAFEKFRKIPLDDAMKDVIYNLGLDYERKRMTNKAVSIYEYITQKDKNFRDLGERIPKLKKIIGSLALGGLDQKKDNKLLLGGDLEIKPTVGRYEVLEELGQGAMGIVYKARDPKINRLLAIKTIRFSDEFDEKGVDDVKMRFLREAEIAGQLSHNSIVSIYDVGEDFDLTYLAMEYLNGDDLQKFCRKGTLLPLRKVLYIIAETGLALDYAHAQGVIHRDVKPGNIMLLKNGRVKVTDFGIAKAMSTSQTKSGIILGTPNYMSPEQINGQELDGRSDIFSLGVVFFEMLTGRLPFQGKSLANLFYQITQAKHLSPREINPKVPKPCEQIIDRALTKDPDQRFQRGSDLAKYVRALINRMDQLRAKTKENEVS